jgi:hypothetical protein
VVVRFARRGGGGIFVGSPPWPVAFPLVVAHADDAEDNKDPVQVVRDDGPVCCRILPTEEMVEDSPAAAAVSIGITTLVAIS